MSRTLDRALHRVHARQARAPAQPRIQRQGGTGESTDYTHHQWRSGSISYFGLTVGRWVNVWLAQPQLQNLTPLESPRGDGDTGDRLLAETEVPETRNPWRGSRRFASRCSKPSCGYSPYAGLPGNQA